MISTPTLSAQTASAPDGPTLRTATISGRAGKWLFIDRSGERALRAPSCLIEPETGDLVLICSTPAGIAHDKPRVASMLAPAYVLAVLARSDDSQATLTLPAGPALHLREGGLRVNAERIELAASQTLSASAERLEFTGVDAQLTAQRLQTRIGLLDAGIGRLTMVARSVASTVGSLVLRAHASLRRIDTCDELRAGSTHWRADGHAQLSGRQTTIVADTLTRIDGEKIELG